MCYGSFEFKRTEKRQFDSGREDQSSLRLVVRTLPLHHGAPLGLSAVSFSGPT